jgi:hypothetical protein
MGCRFGETWGDKDVILSLTRAKVSRKSDERYRVVGLLPIGRGICSISECQQGVCASEGTESDSGAPLARLHKRREEEEEGFIYVVYVLNFLFLVPPWSMPGSLGQIGLSSQVYPTLSHPFLDLFP